MGVPKFFRFISERYPCLSESVKECQIPEFDHLYLDMNGIIHNCSHPDDDISFRILEETILANIFHYIDFLFCTIKPQKLFFMAIDGVAPRAKMNQQRGRRFKSAQEAIDLEKKAKENGEILPETERFDSNCITPGTEFMAKLHEQLKYFIVNKISTSPLWQKCEIIYSGHETPGEGEHKIMDYIRFLRSKPDYDPNTRHCLYGLDADLVILGLCTHDLHFSLLREEVKFGRQSKKSSVGVPEDIRFFLLHLSLMREYLELEFSPLKESLTNFDFDLEKIIDDWVLMGFLVGNDFIPHLPNLHIHSGALPILYKTYMEILPSLDGYINEGGKLNLKRFEAFMKKLSEFDFQSFEELIDDVKYMKQKTVKRMDLDGNNSQNVKNLEEWQGDEVEDDMLPLEPDQPKNVDLNALIQATEDEFGGDVTSDQEFFTSYKRSYYTQKLEYQDVTPEVLKSQAEGYVRAIQWNLNYYYNGVCSWSWFYPHHYAPYISDIKDFANLNLEYDLGKPFLPYQQLLGVLPSASKQLLPPCYRNLMTNDSSAIKKYYPETFETDLNGKKQPWEAIVLVPFIDEEALLEAMKTCDSGLSKIERQRNRHGPMLKYFFTEKNLGQYDCPQYFPSVKANHAEMIPITIDEIKVPIDQLIKGRHPKASGDIYYPGFPTLKHLNYTGKLERIGVTVFNHPSREESMVIKVVPSEESQQNDIPMDLLGKTVFVGWPHLTDARVVSIFNEKDQYNCAKGTGHYNAVKTSNFKTQADEVSKFYKSRMAIEYGKSNILLEVQKFVGQKYMSLPNGEISLEKVYSKITSIYPLQLIVKNLKVYKSTEEVHTTIESMLPEGSICFTMTNPFYGAQGTVQKYTEKNSRVKILINITSEPDLSELKREEEEIRCSYKTLHAAASQLSMSPYAFARITGTFYIDSENEYASKNSFSIGLGLKMSKKNIETPGYTKRIDNIWYYSEKAIELVGEYANKFPEVIRFLSRNKCYDKETCVKDIFEHNGRKKSADIEWWLQQFDLPKSRCSSNVLSKESIEKLENIVDNFKGETKSLVLQIKPNFLYKPGLTKGNVIPDPTALIYTFDRVINVSMDSIVPFALKGTVIGIHGISKEEKTFDVLFDKQFERGQTLGASSKRCYTLPQSALINISHGLRTYTQKVGKPGELINSLNNDNKNQQTSKPSQFNQRNVPMKQPPNSAFAFYNYMGPQKSYQHPPQMQQQSFQHFFNGQPIFQQSSNRNYHHQAKTNMGANVNIAAQNKPNRSVQKATETVPNLMPNFKKSGSSTQEDTLKQLLKIGQDNKNTGLPVEYKECRQKLDNMSIQDKTTSVTQECKKKAEDKSHPKYQLKKQGKQNSQLVHSGLDNRSTQAIDGNSSYKQFSENHHIPKSKTASVILLGYYQSKGLGLPRYQYFESEEGIQSQIKLPNRQIIFGTPSKTRDQASENVAKEALKILGIEENDNCLVKTDAFPSPPKQWVQSKATKTSSPRKTDNSTKISSPRKTDNLTKTSSPRKTDNPANPFEKFKCEMGKQDVENWRDHDVLKVYVENHKNTKPVDWKGLVPLQVQKKATKSSDKSLADSKDIAKKKEINPRPSADQKKPVPNSSELGQEKDQKKARKERTMRIAANFSMK